jgi:hypothetical protein
MVFGHFKVEQRPVSAQHRLNGVPVQLRVVQKVLLAFDLCS